MRFTVLAFVVIVAVSVSAADPPYVGHWKLNVDKSDFGTVSLSFTDEGQGRVRAAGAIASNGTFRFDGKEYRSDDGWLASWTAVDAHSWKAVYKVNGTVTTIDQLGLSPDDKTLTIDRTEGVGRTDRQETFVLTRT